MDIHSNYGATKADQGHRFRSKLIDKLALAESLLNPLFQDDGRETNGGARIPHHLGHKLEEARKVTSSQPDRFRSAERAEELMGRIKPFLELRSKLAHSVLSVGQIESGETLFIFDCASARADPQWQSRVSIREEECRAIISAVSGLVNELKTQVL